MKCVSCGEVKSTVGEVRGCRRCQKQGVTIDARIDGDAPLEVAVVGGLANRFIHDRPARQVETQPPAADPAPTKPARRRDRS